ncbi:hypothetical protein FACS1894166_06950 [Bacilli bacterium]|nr:hypothetical protein FACS1894166_06950 [Bacilli bacterium]
MYRNLQKLIEDYKNHHIYIIGGKTIYELMAPLADELIVSRIKKNYNCNRFMHIDFTNFKLVKSVPHEEFIAE